MTSPAIVARADIVPVSGTLSAAATFDWTMGNVHLNDSHALTLGTDYGDFSTGAAAGAGVNATVHTSRTPTSLSFNLTGVAASGGASQWAQIWGSFSTVFTLTAPADLEETGTQNADPHFMYASVLRDSANQSVPFAGPGMVPAGTYRYFSVNDCVPVGPGVGSGAMDMHRTLFVVPEPATALVAGSAAFLATRKRRRASRPS